MATGQRIGSAAGVAVVGSVFYALYADGGAVDAVAGGIGAVAVLVALALVPGLVDLRAAAREQRGQRVRAEASGEPHERHHRAASVP